MRNGGAQDWVPVLREIGKQKRRVDEQSMEDCARYLKDAGAEGLRREGMRLTFRLPDVKRTENTISDTDGTRSTDAEKTQSGASDSVDGQFCVEICGDRVILSRLLAQDPGQEAQREPGRQGERQFRYREKENRLELRSVFRRSDLRRGRLAADILKMNHYVFCPEQTYGK